jgi:hypothetical protein
MNVAAGFNTGFSFFYLAVDNPGLINVYDGLDGTGTVLATLNLPTTLSNRTPVLPIGVNFAGVAKSVDFGTAFIGIVVDNITLGSAVPGGSTAVPEPFTIVGTLIGSAAAFKMRKRLKVNNKL